MSFRTLALQSRLWRTRRGQVLERGPRAAAARCRKTTADSLRARVSELAWRERPSAARRPGGRAGGFAFLPDPESFHRGGQRHEVRFRRTPAQYLEDQELRGFRYSLGGGSAGRLEAFLRRPDPHHPPAGIGNLGYLQPGPGTGRCLAAFRRLADAGFGGPASQLER